MSNYQFLHLGSYVKIIMHNIPEKPGVFAKIFNLLANQQIDVLTVRHSLQSTEKGDIAFTVSTKDAEKSLQLMTDNIKLIEASHVSSKKDLALVFIWGKEIKSISKFASDILRAFCEYNIDFDSLSLAQEGLTVILPDNQFQKAAHAFNKMFIDEPIISPI
ncbi:hypothetical protein L0128_23310 [candidate division KSB1 bacterium]|nr:hypothetical protein [candidate division KSB1 bacterium]